MGQTRGLAQRGCCCPLGGTAQQVVTDYNQMHSVPETLTRPHQEHYIIYHDLTLPTVSILIVATRHIMLSSIVSSGGVTSHHRAQHWFLLANL